MFAWLKKASAFVHQTFDRCMDTPDYNSRLIFLGTAVFTQLVIIWHTFNYLHSPAKDSNYPSILMILLGGHGVNAFGRLMTKRVGEKKDADKDAAPAPTGTDGEKG